MTNYNKSAYYSQSLLVIVLLLVGISQSKSKTQVAQIQDLQSLTFIKNNESTVLELQMGHHSAKLQVVFGDGRSWIKDELCKMCDQATGQCNGSCADSSQDLKISCDTVFCDNLGEYKNQQENIEGILGQVFIKFTNKKQILMPLVFATKLYGQHQQNGVFNVFDSESSINQGIFYKNNHGVYQLINVNLIQKEKKSKLIQKQGQIINITVAANTFNFQFLRVNNMKLHHLQSQKFKQINIPINNISLHFTLQSQSISLPPKLFHKLQKQLLDVYFANKTCKLTPGKIKCKQQISIKNMNEALLEFKINNFTLSIPIHVLFSSCSKNQCNVLIDTKTGENCIQVGSIVWEIFNLEYSINYKFIAFHRKDNQWSSLYSSEEHIDPVKDGFLSTVLTLLFHIFIFVFKVVFYLALLSLIINCLFKWKTVLLWFKKMLFASKNKGNRLNQHQDQQQLSTRKISKLPQFLQDSQTM